MKENAGTQDLRLEQMFGVKKEQSVLRMQHLNWLPTGNMLNKDEKKASKQAKLLNIANKFRASHCHAILTSASFINVRDVKQTNCK